MGIICVTSQILFLFYANLYDSLLSVVIEQFASYLKQFAESPNSQLTRLFREWQILKSEIPKGFEKFYPGGKKAPAKPETQAPKAEPAKGFKHTNLFFNFILNTIF